MKSLPILVFTLLLFTICAFGKPNFVFVMADDCTWYEMGCYGGQAKTPHFDRLAAEGMRFDNCFQSSSTCSPTRHNIFTGQYPFKTGAYPNHTFAKDGTKSVAHYLEPLGYRVAMSGKRHISPREVFPFEYLGKGQDPEFDKIEAFVKECSDAGTPFCLFVTSKEPHAPWDKGDPSVYPLDEIVLPATFVDTPETREAMSRYLAEISYFDWQIGETMSLMEKYGLWDNTLFVAATEQGTSLPMAKWTCYDAGIKAGMVARWPGKIEKGSVSASLVEYADLVPTFVAAAGGELDLVLDGKSLLGVFAAPDTEVRDYVFSQTTTKGILNGSEHYGIRSVRSLNYKYIWNFTPEVKYQNVVTIEEDTKWGESTVFNSWKERAKTDAAAAKKVRAYEWRPEEELYLVSDDVDELNNLADSPEYADVKAKLRKRMVDYMGEVGDLGQESEENAHLYQAKNRGK
ncbi:MAG: sulfatase [Verrucomicrobiota bacterium]